MKIRELANLAVKLTGIICLVIAAYKLQQVVIMFLAVFNQKMDMPGASYVTAATLLSFVLVIAAGIALLTFSRPIAERISRNDSVIGDQIEYHGLLFVSLAVLGAWIVLVSFPKLLESLAFVMMSRRSGIDASTPHFQIRYVPQLISNTVQFLLGLWLFFGTKGVIGL